MLPPSGADPQTLTRMSPAALLSRWHATEGLDVYRPYIAAEVPQGPLDAISSPAPAEGSDVNWLNIFYAIEWAVFAGFAFYLWYRLARDAWEREVEELEDAANPSRRILSPSSFPETHPHVEAAVHRSFDCVGRRRRTGEPAGRLEACRRPRNSPHSRPSAAR